MNFRKVSALASVAVLAFAACSNTGGGTPSPVGTRRRQRSAARQRARAVRQPSTPAGR